MCPYRADLCDNRGLYITASFLSYSIYLREEEEEENDGEIVSLANSCI